MRETPIQPQMPDAAEFQRRLVVIDRAVAAFNALPVVGPPLTDDDLYDEDGFPK